MLRMGNEEVSFPLSNVAVLTEEPADRREESVLVGKCSTKTVMDEPLRALAIRRLWLVRQCVAPASARSLGRETNVRIGATRRV